MTHWDCLGYIRVSTEQQAGDDRTSLPEQRRAITERAVALGRVLLPGAVFEDAGVSGATAEGRPAFMAMLRHCEAHPRGASAPGMIVVLNDSRFGRFEDVRESQHWQFVLAKLGWAVRFVEGDDIEAHMPREIMRLMGAAQATEYRQNLKRTARRASRTTAAEGRWQNEAPLGYRRLATRRDGAQRVLDPGQRKADDEIVRLTLGPIEEQEIVRFIYDAYATGQYSISRLAAVLDERWPRVRKWSKGTLNAFLRNQTYLGDVLWGRRPHDPAERRATRVRDASQWIVVRDAHPAIIDRVTFAVVQSRLASNKRERRATVGGYPLSGMVTCATCGQVFIGGGGRRGPEDDPDRYRFYRDKGALKERPGDDVVPCVSPIATLRKRWLEHTLVLEVGKVVREPHIQHVIVEEIDRALDMAQGGHTERRATLERELAQLQASRKRVVDAVASGILLEREATMSLAEQRARIAAVEAELDRTRFAARRTAAMESLRSHFITLAQDFATQALRAQGPALRELVRPWLKRAVYDKTTRLLTLTIRKVPEVMGMSDGMLLHEQPRQDGQKRSRRLYVVRRIRVPDSPVVAMRKRAGGAR